MTIFRPLNASPTLRFLDRIAAWYLTKRHNAVMSVNQAVGARTLIHRLEQYVDRSGHLNTVNGRKPHAVKRLKKALDAIGGVLRPGITYHHKDGTKETRVVA